MYTVAFSLILQVVLLGTDQSFVRMFSEHKEADRSTLMWNCLAPSLTISAFAAILLLLLKREVSLLLFDSPDHLMPVFIMIATIVIAVLERFATLVLRMKKRGIAFSSLRVVHAAAQAGGLIFYALVVARNFYAVIFGTFISHVVVLIVSVYMERSFWKKGFALSKTKIREAVLYGLPFVPAFMVTWLFQSMDKLALRSFSTFDQIGLYAAANKVVAVLLLIQAGFSTFWTPVAYEKFEKKPEDSVFFGKMFGLLSAVMFIMGLLVIGFKDLIILILDRAYLPAASIMPFLIFHPIMYTVSETTVMGINFLKKTYWHMAIALIAASANLVGNILFVPTFGARGAALSTGLSYIIFFYSRTLISRKLYPVDYRLARFTIAVMCCVSVALINTFIDSRVLEIGSVVIGLTAASIMYRKELRYSLKMLRDFIYRRKRTSKQ